MSRKSRWWLIGLVGLLIILGLLWFFNSRHAEMSTNGHVVENMGNASQAIPSLTIKQTDVMTVASGALIELIPVSGSLQAEHRADISAKVAGRLIALNVKEGEVVKKGQVLAQVELLDSEARNTQQQAALDQANTQLATAERNYKNDKVLFEKGFIAKNSFQNTEAELERAKAAVISAQAALEQSKKTLSDTKIISPIAGQIAERFINVGENVRVDQKLLSVVNINRIEIPLSVPIERSSGVKVGTAALLTFDKGADASDSLITKVGRVTPAATEGNRFIQAYVVLENSSLQYRPGMFVSGYLVAKELKNIVRVPLDSVREQLGEKVMYVINNKKIEVRKVKLGRSGVLVLGSREPSWVEVVQGLLPDDVVIAKDLGNLVEGRSVVLVP